MKTQAPLALAAVAGTAALFGWSARWPASAQAPTPAAATAGLPGAIPEVLAEKYPSIQAAVDALPEAGGLVRLPAGTFEIREPIVVTRGDVSIVGAGTATHVKNVNGEGKPALVVRPAALAAEPKAMLWRARLADFRLTGNASSGHGVEATNVNELYLDGLTVSGHGGDGVRMVNCYEDPRIIGCLITYNKKTGVHLEGCHDIVVSANQFEENRDALRCLDGYNLCMTGNCLDDHLGDGVVIENTYGSVVSGNMIEECAGTAVILDRDCYGITLSANVIAHEVSGGIDLRDAHGCAVSANTFTIVKKNALVIGPASSRIAVTGNAFADSFIGEGAVKRLANDREASGLTLDGTSDVAVVGNLFSGLKPKGIEVEGDGVRRVLVSENVFTEVESDHGRLPGARPGANLEP